MTAKRIIELDILRGIALFGILLVNIFVFNAPYLHHVEHYGQFTGSQQLILSLNDLLFASKMMPIYAFLFGFGIFIIQSKFDSQKLFEAYFSKRMLILLLFGIIHLCFFTFGDILIPYVLIGLLLLVEKPDKVTT